MRDDGRGLTPGPIRQRLLELGWYQPAQLDQLSDQQILAHIFKPGFSTAAPGGEHAGRGVGLDLVQQEVARLGATMRLQSTPGQGTKFSIVLS